MNETIPDIGTLISRLLSAMLQEDESYWNRPLSWEKHREYMTEAMLRAYVDGGALIVVLSSERAVGPRDYDQDWTERTGRIDEMARTIEGGMMPGEWVFLPGPTSGTIQAEYDLHLPPPPPCPEPPPYCPLPEPDYLTPDIADVDDATWNRERR